MPEGVFLLDGKKADPRRCDIHDWARPIKIILTVAHLNHDEADTRPENLAHLCQLHHNRHDAKHRAVNRTNNRKAR
jgi:hypothetical protein